jgi:polysaccharide deacetylase family protein (PEP-CTERM system associated)
MEQDNPLNLLTVDLEEWFVVEIFSERFEMNQWEELPSTVVRNTRRLLSLFERHDVRATFFVLGWIAQRYPDLLQELVNRGHEVACHSFGHRRVDKMSVDDFRRDTEMAVDAIVKAIGNRPAGYRAPSWSINDSIPWAFQTLAELGFEYDSSLFPIKHDIYGIPDGPRRPFKMTFDNGRYLYELPASTVRVLGRNIPLAGGGFFRHSPYWYSRRMVRKLNSMGQPAVVYIHPWEFDPDPPRITGLSTLQKYRTYSSTSLLLYKFNKLLKDFEFTTVSDYLYRFKKRRIGFR